MCEYVCECDCECACGCVHVCVCVLYDVWVLLGAFGVHSSQFCLHGARVGCMKSLSRIDFFGFDTYPFRYIKK